MVELEAILNEYASNESYSMRYKVPCSSAIVCKGIVAKSIMGSIYISPCADGVKIETTPEKTRTLLLAVQGKGTVGEVIADGMRLSSRLPQDSMRLSSSWVIMKIASLLEPPSERSNTNHTVRTRAHSAHVENSFYVGGNEANNAV